MIEKLLFLVGVVWAFAATGPPQAAAQLPLIVSIARPAQPDAIPLYAVSKAGAAPKQWETFGGGRIVRDMVDPTLTPVLPAASKAPGPAVIVAPGGGFLMLSMDSEGCAVARWLADHGGRRLRFEVPIEGIGARCKCVPGRPDEAGAGNCER